MNTIYLIIKFFKGIKIHVAFLIIMMTFSIFLGVIAYGTVKYITIGRDFIDSSEVKEGYYYCDRTLWDEEFDCLYEDEVKEVYRKFDAQVEKLKNNENVEKVLYTKTATPLDYNGKSTNIILYSEELLEAFPELKKYGVDFKENESACILGSRMFNQISEGEKIELTFYSPEKHTRTFDVVGHLDFPYPIIKISGYDTYLDFSQMIEYSGYFVIMKETEENIRMLEEITRVAPYYNMIIVFKDGVESEVRESILSELEDSGTWAPVSEVYDNTAVQIENKIKENTPRIFFLLCISSIAFFSTSILLINKKNRENSIYYLCGCSKRKNTLIVFISLCMISAVPVLLNIVFVKLWPYLQWKGLANFDSILITGDVIPFILMYFLITVLITVCALLIPSAGRSPIVYLKGVER